MTPKKLRALRMDLVAMKKSPQGRKARDFEAFAVALGRKKSGKGKEPTWVREVDPHLSYPLSIPHHGGNDLPPGTARSIIHRLLEDCDEWTQHMNMGSDDED